MKYSTNDTSWGSFTLTLLCCNCGCSGWEPFFFFLSFFFRWGVSNAAVTDGEWITRLYWCELNSVLRVLWSGSGVASHRLSLTLTITFRFYTHRSLYDVCLNTRGEPLKNIDAERINCRMWCGGSHSVAQNTNECMNEYTNYVCWWTLRCCFCNLTLLFALNPCCTIFLRWISFWLRLCCMDCERDHVWTVMNGAELTDIIVWSLSYVLVLCIV